MILGQPDAVLEHSLRHHQVDYDLEVGTRTGNVSHVQLSIVLSDEDVADLFDEAYEGWCPICRNTKVSGGETICCECFREALSYHAYTCGCHEWEVS